MKWTRDTFVDYLKGTLIPDLRESGSDATADDFMVAVAFIEDLGLEEVEVAFGETTQEAQ